MSEFVDQLVLLITATDKGAVNVIKGIATQTNSELSKVEGNAATHGANAGQAFGKGFGDQALLGVAAFRAAVGSLAVISFGRGATDAAVALQRTTEELKVELQGTGAAAGTTDAQIDHLAQSVQKSDAIYSGTTKSAAALLLTLREIQNQAGAGNDIFNRTLVVSGAVANVFGKDMTTAALQLGKALENPVSGVQQLQRAGIALSQSLRAQINDLAKHGDLLGAQKALLDELEKRYLAAGAAIAKADPFKQFGVELTTLKTQVGADVLPALTPLLSFASGMLEGFGKLPVPIRVATEALVGLGAVAVPLLRVKQVLDSISLASSAGIASGAGGIAASSEAQAVAAETAATSTTYLDTVLAQYNVEAETATVETSALADTLAAYGIRATVAAGESAGLTSALQEQAAAQTEVAATAGVTLGGGFVAAIAGVVAFTATYSTLKGLISGHHTPFADLSTDAQRLATDVNDLAHKDIFQKGFGLSPTIGQDKTDIADLNEGLKQLADSAGPLAAFNEVQSLSEAVRKAGGDVDQLNASLSPAITYIQQLEHAAVAAAGAAGDLDSQFTALSASLDKVGTSFSVLDGIDAIHAAERKVVQDQQDIAGTSQQAVSATRAVQDAFRSVGDAERGVNTANQNLTDSYQRLTDAQLSYSDATHQLAEAQKALADFNSQRGQLERSLEADSINRRVVTTPAEEDQKRLDELRLQDNTSNQQQSLQDRVTSATRSVSAAQRSIADANKAIASAQQGVLDATERVVSAEEDLKAKILARQKVHDDATQSIVGDERKVKEAIKSVVDTIQQAIDKGVDVSDSIDKWLGKLDDLAQKYAPGSELERNIDQHYRTILDGERAINNPHDSKAQKAARRDINPLAGAATGVPTPPTASPSFQPPGFADGGTVPGPIGHPVLALVHGGETIRNPKQEQGLNNGGGVTIQQENHFYGDTPSTTDLDYANRALAWGIAKSGRGG